MTSINLYNKKLGIETKLISDSKENININLPNRSSDINSTTSMKDRKVYFVGKTLPEAHFSTLEECLYYVSVNDTINYNQLARTNIVIVLEDNYVIENTIFSQVDLSYCVIISKRHYDNSREKGPIIIKCKNNYIFRSEGHTCLPIFKGIDMTIEMNGNKGGGILFLGAEESAFRIQECTLTINMRNCTMEYLNIFVGGVNCYLRIWDVVATINLYDTTFTGDIKVINSSWGCVCDMINSTININLNGNSKVNPITLGLSYRGSSLFLHQCNFTVNNATGKTVEYPTGFTSTENSIICLYNSFITFKGNDTVRRNSLFNSFRNSSIHIYNVNIKTNGYKSEYLYAAYDTSFMQSNLITVDPSFYVNGKVYKGVASQVSENNIPI